MAMMGVYPSYAATDDVSLTAIRELTTQTKTFQEETKKQISKTGEKPEVTIEKEKPEETPEETGPSFFVKKIKLEGNTLFPEKKFEPIVSKYENQKISIGELKSLSRQITSVYRAQGYLTSRAYVPPQEIDNETATIKIMEGKVGDIVVEGNRYFSKEVYLDSMHLRSDRILSYSDIEDNLYFLNLKPDRQAKAYLIPGTEPAVADIVLKVEDSVPYHAFYEFNNRGTKLTHLGRHLMYETMDNVTGHGDALSAFVSLAEEGAVTAVASNYSFPIEKLGMTFNASGSYSKSRLIGDFKPFDVKGESINFSTDITQSFIKTMRVNLDGFVGFDLADSKTMIGGPKTSFDRMRVFKTGPRLSVQDNNGRTMVNAEVDWGIPNFLGSLGDHDPNASRPNSGGDFLFYTANVARLQRLPFWSSNLLLRTGGQWSRDTLASVEEFRLGGVTTVRGYPESDSLGDYGYNFSAEFNTAIPFLPAAWKIPFTNKKWTDSLRAVAFIDGGETFLRERLSSTSIKQSFLLGTGGGLRFNLDQNLSVQVDLGFPIGDDSSDKNLMQTHLSARSGF